VKVNLRLVRACAELVRDWEHGDVRPASVVEVHRALQKVAPELRRVSVEQSTKRIEKMEGK
jgi:hypothetical protein